MQQPILDTGEDPWFTSDQHYGHANVIRYCSRPFELPEGELTEEQKHRYVSRMNEELILRHNQLVQPDDFVFHLGDFSLSMTWVDLIAPRLLGRHASVPGNHDWTHSSHEKKANKHEQAKRRFSKTGFTILPEQYQWTAPTGEKLLLCHLPYWSAGESESSERRYPNHRPPVGDEFALLCGHVHEKWRCRRHESGKLMYNVGVDQHDLRPVRWSQIRAVLIAEATDDRLG